MPEFGFDPGAAVRHLRAADPQLAAVIDATGPFAMELKTSRSTFAALAEAIVYQQLHGKAAEAILATADLYAAAPDGLIPWKSRPDAFKKGVVARIPALAFAQTEIAR